MPYLDTFQQLKCLRTNLEPYNLSVSPSIIGLNKLQRINFDQHVSSINNTECTHSFSVVRVQKNK